MTKVLVIEDDNILRADLMECLMFEGFEVLGAEDGVVGLALAYQHLPDLIVCDVMMPNLGGHAVLRELRTNPLTMTIPFIFVTAMVMHDDIAQGMDLGA